MKSIAGVPLEKIIDLLHKTKGNAAAVARQLGIHEKNLQRQIRHGRYSEIFEKEFPDRVKQSANSGYQNFIHVQCRNDRCNNTVAITIVPGTDAKDYDLRRYCTPCKSRDEETYHTEFRDFTECWV